MPKKQKKKDKKERVMYWCDNCCQNISLITNPKAIHTCYDYREQARKDFEQELEGKIKWAKLTYSQIYKDFIGD